VGGESFNLDFQSLPYFGEEDVVLPVEQKRA
jgi:hypothetical protein